ncbi:hypothetical protein WKI71_43665 [Streptomyces sp. MS1.AVA.1]|uniref:Uncharacterized protein n=1 Tax=Streptomyces machairae TaxID=3134109 RepID=A0ABU8UVX9_9ACTN
MLIVERAGAAAGLERYENTAVAGRPWTGSEPLQAPSRGVVRL